MTEWSCPLPCMRPLGPYYSDKMAASVTDQFPYLHWRFQWGKLINRNWKTNDTCVEKEEA